MAGTVVELDRRGAHLDLRTDHGEIVRLPADYLAHARHGYALTGHVAQGASVDRTFILASPERGGAEWAYVAGSRQRHDLQVFVVHHEPAKVEVALARAWSRSQAKSLALDLVDPGHRAVAIEAARADLAGASPEHLLALADDLRARRDEAREQARATADDRLRRLDLTRALERAESALRDAEWRHAHLAERLEWVPPWRRRERADLRAGLARAGEEAARQRGRAAAARDSLARLGPGDDASDRAGRLGEELARVERRLGRWREPVGRGIDRREIEGRGRGLAR
jgi:hypothetical protein